MYIKFHKMGEREVIAVCDEDLLGKEFSEGELNLKISIEFYGGEKKNKYYVENILKKGSNINIVGKKSIQIAIDLGILNKKNILFIDKIPYAFIFGF